MKAAFLRPTLRSISCASMMLIGIGLILNASYIQLKAQLAQVLLSSAYAKQIQQTKQAPIKPWPWADTHVVAKLEILGQTDYVLANASMRNLAFGPTHVDQSAALGSDGNSVIIGHRDTHFSHLQDVKIGTPIRLHHGGELTQYAVVETLVVNEEQVAALVNMHTSALTLITCYPFNDISPNPTKRFVVRAIKTKDLQTRLFNG